jgi:hypothetical protein
VGRKFNALILTLIVAALLPGLVCAQLPGRNGSKELGPGSMLPGSGRVQTWSPEDRERFSRNAERWIQMDAEQRKIMREREKLRRQHLQQEAERAFRESGLHLDAEKRAAFESRYVQERARLEHSMHQELEAKRQTENSALVERLKKEFQSEQPKPSATVVASASPKSGN